MTALTELMDVRQARVSFETQVDQIMAASKEPEEEEEEEEEEAVQVQPPPAKKGRTE